jgi:hypothetical protein
VCIYIIYIHVYIYRYAQTLEEPWHVRLIYDAAAGSTGKRREAGADEAAVDQGNLEEIAAVLKARSLVA